MHTKERHFADWGTRNQGEQNKSDFQPINGKEKQDKSKPKAQLNKQAWLLLLVNGLFGAANSLSGAFVTVYIWKVKNDFVLIGWFAFTHQIAMAITFYLAGKWVKEGNKMNTLRIGVALSAIFYLSVLFLEKEAVNWIVMLGCLQGIASGLFWLAFNVVYFEITDANNRDRFNGMAGLLGSGAGMLAPWISGFVITRLPGNVGYRWIFAVSLSIFVVGVVISFFLKKRKVEGTYEWLLGYRTLRQKGGVWRKVFTALVAQGMREGVFGFIIALLIYMATQSEMHIGNFSLITSAVALVSFMVVGKFLKPTWRKWTMLIGVTMMIAVIVPFFWSVNYTALLIFGIGTALFIPMYSIPMTSSVFDIIGRDEKSASQRVEYVVLRETGLNIGRMSGTLVFILVITLAPSSPLALNWLLLGIGSSPLLAWLFMRNQLTLKSKG